MWKSSSAPERRKWSCVTGLLDTAMLPSHSFVNRKRSISAADSRRRSLSEGELSSQLMRKNQDLARENAVLRAKCRMMEQKMQALEKIDVDVYPQKVERLVESVKPMYEELALFKGKIEEFQQMIRRGMDDVLAVPSAKRTSVAAFCRLSETERQLHRQAAGQRLQDVANTWELRQMGRISIANLPTTAENVSDVFEPEFQEDTANQSFHSLIPRMTTSITNNVPKHFPVRDVMSGAAGDQLLISDAQDPEPRQVSGPEDTNVAAPVVFDELTDMTHAKEDPKPEVAKRKGTRSRAGCSSGARRQPRAKKTVVAAASGDNVEVSDFTEATTQRVAESSTDDEVNAGQKLRPRRKGINYRDMEEASAPTVKKKPVKRTKKTAE